MNRTIAALAIAASAIAGVASANTGYNYFELPQQQKPTTQIELGLVRTSAPATVEIHANDGTLVGTTTVAQGATGDLRVNLDRQVFQDVRASIVIDGQVVAEQVIPVSR